MTTAYPYRTVGASGSYNSDINGYKFQVTIVLQDVPGDTDVARMFNALTDPNIPLIGSDLSGVNLDLTGCWNRDISCRPLSNGDMELTLNYQHSPLNDLSGIQIRVTTQTSEVESNKDKDGESINTVYKYPDDYGGDKPTTRESELRGTFSDPQGGTFSKLVPETTRVYEIRENVDPGFYKSLVGTINDADWLESGDQYKWMLTNVSGTIDNSQQTPTVWVNSYTFQYRVDNWWPEVVHVDANTNQPVPDPQDSYAPEKPVDFGGSKVSVEAYVQNDFSSLFPEFT
jgi:hypothetical protein